MSRDKKYSVSWAEKTGNALVDPLLDKLDKTAGKRSDEEMQELVGHVVSVLVHSMVINSLSVREEEVAAGTDMRVLYKSVGTKFAHMKALLEAGIVSAFEIGVSQAAKQDTLYLCKIQAVGSAANELPC